MKTKVEAKRPVAKRASGDDGPKMRALEKRLAEAFEQQAATSEIMRVMAVSPNDVQPVLDAVAERAAHLCKAPFARVFLVDGDVLRSLAEFAADGGNLISAVPIALKRTSVSGRAVLDGKIVHHADIVPLVDTQFPDARENVRRSGSRAVLAVPLQREAGAFGALYLWRREPGLFAPDQVALVQTFARQAAIAIDSVRLFKETKEALEQQTATSEILRAISRSPTNVKPVFETIAANALRLCDATFSVCYRFDGELIHIAALHHLKPEGIAAFHAAYPCPPSRGGVTQRAILTGTLVHVADVLQDPEYVYLDAAKRADYRSVLAVPMLRDGRTIGAISVFREMPGMFPDTQVTLLQTFADQAIIAVANVHLFTELEARNHDLAEALERQTATSEILAAIANSPTDIESVLETVARATARFCAAPDVIILRVDDNVLRGAAGVGAYADVVTRSVGRIDALEIPLSKGSVSGRAALEQRSIHIHDLAAESEDEYPMGRELQRRFGHRTMLATPLLREGLSLGVVALFRMEVKPFSDRQVELLKTFADQAVIAIENARLFRELETRNRDLTEALEQQTATSEILRVISSSPTDVQPVFDIIAQRAGKLCGADVAVVSKFGGKLIELAAIHGLVPEGVKVVRTLFPMEVGAQTVTARVIRGSAVVHIADVFAEQDYALKHFAQAAQYRAALGVPIVRNRKVIGSIFVGRATPGLFTDSQAQLLKTFADQAVIAIENVRLFRELETRNRDLTVALEQQTATSDILRVISQSQTDVQPVFEAIAASAMTLCGAGSGNVFTFDGELIHVGALVNVNPEYIDALRHLFPRPPSRDLAATRAIQTCSVVAIPDWLEDPDVADTEVVLAGGFRSVLAVPLVHDGNPIGAIAVGRPEPGLYSDNQIALLKTFADQAVIAIENVRLFRELETRNRDLTVALEQQTATSEVLHVISQSPTDVQPVFATIAAAALKLCTGNTAIVATYDGELIHVGALANADPKGAEAIHKTFPRPPSAESATARAVQTNDLVIIPDILIDRAYAIQDYAMTAGFRSIMAVPLTRDGTPIGAITVGRPEPGPFSEKEIALLQTFAHQAVIAIENVRLFKELQTRNRDLTVALDQQTATSEVLRVISQSQTDVQPVFDTIAQAALKLCGAGSANVFTFDGELIHLAALVNVNAKYGEELRGFFPRPPGPDTAVTRAILLGRVIEVPDVLKDPNYAIAPNSIIGGFRSVLAVPLIREGSPIGGVAVGRLEPGPFSDNQITLLQTFADQAVIAIENVRLFKELEARTTQLTQSVGELKALGEVGQAVSSTLDLGTVLSTIVARATGLAGMDGGALYEYDEAREEFHLHTTDRLPDELVDALRASRIPKGEGAIGALAVTFEPVEIRDTLDEGIYQSRVREILVRLGYRSLLAVPLLREDHLLGGLVVNRKSAGDFAPQVIDLLKTFATQSALAIQNARLFREIEDKSRQLEVASQHKSEFLANMSHELRTPLNAIIGFSEVLAERMFGEVNDKQAEYLADILESGRHLLSLINDILDLSKIEAGRMELDLSDFNLPGAVENTLTLVRERAHRRGIALERTVDPGLAIIRADERKVKQVMLNLLSNALKFTPEGGRIDVRAEVRDGMAELAVTDTGVGIAPEDQAAVFEEFRQVGSAAKKIEGTGLGLAISRKFIELHGGKIWVTSQVGAGSTFAFTLPLPTTSDRLPD